MIPVILARPVTIRMGNNSKKDPEYKPSKKNRKTKDWYSRKSLLKH